MPPGPRSIGTIMTSTCGNSGGSSGRKYRSPTYIRPSSISQPIGGSEACRITETSFVWSSTCGLRMGEMGRRSRVQSGDPNPAEPVPRKDLTQMGGGGEMLGTTTSSTAGSNAYGPVCLRSPRRDLMLRSPAHPGNASRHRVRGGDDARVEQATYAHLRLHRVRSTAA